MSFGSGSRSGSGSESESESEFNPESESHVVSNTRSDFHRGVYMSNWGRLSGSTTTESRVSDVTMGRISPARSEPSDIGADGRERVCRIPGGIGDVMPLVWPNAVQTVRHSASVTVESFVFHLSFDVSEYGH